MSESTLRRQEESPSQRRRSCIVTRRGREPEIMDDPGLDQKQHVKALQGLSRLNGLSRTVATVWRPIRRLARRKNRDRLRVLDIASGAGDIPIGLWRRARRAGLHLDIEAVDLSPRAVAYAQAKAAERGAPIEFHILDALDQDLPTGFDVLTTSLFLHHLDEEQAVRLLRKMAQAARHLVLVNDLRRSPGGLVLAYLATHLFSTSHVVRTDALRSVRAAFTIAEARDLAERAGLTGAIVLRRWPFRFLLEWERPG